MDGVPDNYGPDADATKGGTSFSGDTSIVEGNTDISFDGTDSSDPEGDSLSYTWTLEDGTTSSGSTTTHDYADAISTNGGNQTFNPDLQVNDGTSTDTDSDFASITVYNDFDGDGKADDDSATGVQTDADDDDDGITDGSDPAPYNVYPSASDSSSESTTEDSTLTVSNGDSADLTELATDGGKSYDPNTDPISIEQIDGESFSAGSTVTLSSGATVTVSSDGSWTYDPNGAYDSLGSSQTETDEFNYTVSDDQHSGTAAATDQGTVSITINGVNTAPTDPTDDNIGTNEVAEDAGGGASVGVDASSTDADGDIITWSLADNASGRFQIDQSGGVTVDNASKVDYEGAKNHDYTITVEASDGTASSTSDFTINVTDVDETPTFTSSGSATVAEDAANGTNVHNAEANVNGSADEGVNYTIMSGNSDGAYAIDGSTGQITINDASQLDYETSTSRTVTVQASESGWSTTQDVTVSVTDADEAPSFSSGTSDTVAEDAANGDTVHDANAGVGGGADTKVSYAITSGNSAEAFSIDSSTGQITVADNSQFDHEGTSSFSLTVEASEGTTTTSQTVSVSVTDVDETPSFTSSTSDTVAEDAANGDTVHDVEAEVNANGATPTDTGVSYQFNSGNSDSAYAIDGSTGQITVNDASQLDYETSTSRTVTIEASEGSQTTTQTVTVSVTDADEAPSFSSGTSDTVAEDAANGDTVHDVNAGVGGDADEAVSYTITSGNSAGAFSIDSSTGQVTVADNSQFDHEGTDSFSLTVEASEGSAATSRTVSVSVTDVDETPSFTSSGSATVAEDAANGDTVHDVNAGVGGDADESVSYAIAGGNTDGAFSVDSSTGQLTVANASAVETELRGQITVTVEASEGSANATQQVTVSVTQVDETPSFTSSGSATVAEDALNSDSLRDVDADVGGDADEDVTYAITGGNGSAAFTLDSATGAVSVADTTKLDHENASTVTLTVEASEGTKSRSQTLTVAVTDADETPTFLSSDSATVAESAATATAVHDANATVDKTRSGNADVGVEYAVVGGNGSAGFAIDNTGQLTVDNASQIDHEGSSTLGLTVEASDGTERETQSLTVTVTDADETPSVISSGSATVVEDDTNGTTVHNIDADVGGSADEAVSYAITGGNGSAALAINSTIGQVTVADTTELDHENASTVTLTVEASEATATGTQTLAVSVASAESTFTQATRSTAEITVTAKEDQTVALSDHLEVEDLSADDTLNFSVAAGPANGTVTGVDGQSIAVTSGGTHTLSAPAYEPDPDIVGTDSFNVTVEDGNGNTETVTVTVTLSPVNDPPEVTLGADRSVTRNTNRQTVSGFAGFQMGSGADEGVQRLTDVAVTSDTPILFETAPEIDTNGTLTYTPADDVSGTATVTVQAQDDNGTSAGGDDTSPNRTFTITVDNVDSGGGGDTGVLFGDEAEGETSGDEQDGDEAEGEISGDEQDGDEAEGESDASRQDSDGGASDSGDGGDGSVAAGGDGDGGDENFVRVEPDQIPEVEIVSMELETEPANSVDATSIVTLENVADVAQEATIRFKLDGEVVAEKTARVPANERINVSHTERVEGEGTHTVQANVETTTEVGTVVRTTDFEIGTVELNENGNEVGAPEDSGDVAESLPALLIAVGIVMGVGVAVLAWRRRE